MFQGRLAFLVAKAEVFHFQQRFRRSGSLLPVKLTDEDIVAVLPTGDTYPYAFVTKENMELQNDQMYTAVLCGATADVWSEGSITDTGIVGLDAAKTYFQRVGEVSASLLD